MHTFEVQQRNAVLEDRPYEFNGRIGVVSERFRGNRPGTSRRQSNSRCLESKILNVNMETVVLWKRAYPDPVIGN